MTATENNKSSTESTMITELALPCGLKEINKSKRNYLTYLYIMLHLCTYRVEVTLCLTEQTTVIYYK